MSEWIEIKEGSQMPKIGYDVLIWCAGRLVIGYYFASSSPIDGWYFRGDLVHGVTHWMPLPAPPETTIDN